MMAMNPRDVEHVALLARIALTEEERARMGRELGAILDFVQTLDALGLENEIALSHVLERVAPSRADEPRPGDCLDRAEVLAQAPEANGVFFLVPTVVDTRG